ncbi:MAG: bifunctional phosphopantothenoylcysteine decarboxylase/phosphopantothenate--cysteine ligase CoaBC [Pseudomonadales bacterium]|nr:bifunctional phosphopantothenoylcysteine decarboxylase/phosphopantothenate--cysteine ligase CoaBC [Pseudomonadales bacterium]
MSALIGKNILLGITGGIAAYKAPTLVRQLRAAGANVQVVLTESAQKFVTTTTLQAVSGVAVRVSIWDEAAESAMGHIELARWADCLLIAPATANNISKLANGIADDLLTTLALATQAPIFIVPAMNQQMWSKPATARNIQQIKSDGAIVLGPASGSQACGETGLGRMLEPEQIVDTLLVHFTTNQALKGQRVVITAGPTREAIDPVRFISNHSSGRQGFALADAARKAGAEVCLICGPVNVETPNQVERINVVTAQQMLNEVMSRLENCDIFIGVAAVADYKPESIATQKIKKCPENKNTSLNLVENPDIIKSVTQCTRPPFTVGFAAETENALENARAKKQRKNLDLIIVNDVSDIRIGFDSTENEVTLIWDSGEQLLKRAPKNEISQSIINSIADVFNSLQKP